MSTSNEKAMSIEDTLRLALEAMRGLYGGWRCETAIKACEEALAQSQSGVKQEQRSDSEQLGEPVAFEEWLSKQHGDPEEIGFLQALRIAYISGQDSITTPYVPEGRQQRPSKGEACRSDIKPLTDDPMDTPLPCDVKVGHVNIRKGVALKTLVARMQVLYDMAITKQKPLTDDEMWALWNSHGSDEMNLQEAVAFARAIEAAHGITKENT